MIYLDKTLSIIIVTYNSSKVILKALEKINFQKYEVIVVDNASQDNTVELVKKNFSSVKIIQNNKNLGYGRANNVALSQINSPLALILNPDAFIDEENLEKLINTISNNPKIAICAPLLLNFYPAQKDDIIQETKVINSNLINDFADYKSVKYIIGACMILKMAVFQKIGFFDNKIFLYYEDDEICDRAIKNNYHCAINLNAQAFHIGHASSGNSWRLIYRRNWHRSLSKFYWKEKQKSFKKSYYSALKLLFSYFFQAIFHLILLQFQQFAKYSGCCFGTLAYLMRKSAFDKNDNPRG